MTKAKSKKPSPTRPPKNTVRPTMNIKIYSPSHIYIDQPAFSLSAVNATGPFDILPQHQNFITLLEAGDVIVSGTDGTRQTVRISRGLLHVKADRATIFLDI